MAYAVMTPIPLVVGVRNKVKHKQNVKASQLMFLLSVFVLALISIRGVHGFALLGSKKRRIMCDSTARAPVLDARIRWPLKTHFENELDQDIVKTIQGPFSTQAFASTYCWGRRPLLIRSAFDTSQLISNDEDSTWPSWDEIIEISMDEDAGARLIQHIPNDLESYTLELGPFSASELQELSNPQANDDRKWTLVVNDVDRFHPPLSDWMDETFSFLPRWRRDDGQVSLAHTGGGIGPHVDNYDVFLIQTSGSRVWEIGSELVSVEKEMTSLVDGIDVRIFRHWEEERAKDGVVRLELSPGDLLYLPPRVAHCGTALSDSCMTLSVGCRAPSASELVSRIAEQISETFTGCAIHRYEDPNLLAPLVSTSEELLTLPDTIGEITTEAKAQMKELVREAVNEIINDDCKWDELVGQIVTESKRPRENYPVPLLQPDGTPCDEEWNESLGVWGDPDLAVQAVLDGSGALYHAEGVALSFSSVSNEASQKIHHRLFANGEMFEIVTDTENKIVPIFLCCICNQRQLTKESLVPLFRKQQENSEMMQLLRVFVSKGVLYGSEE